MELKKEITEYKCTSLIPEYRIGSAILGTSVVFILPAFLLINQNNFVINI